MKDPGCCGVPFPRSEEPGIAGYLPFSKVPAVIYFAAVVLALMLAPSLPKRGELLTDAVAFAAGALWCGINARRGGQAHCLITSAGWLLLSAGVFAEAWLGRSLIHGDEQLVFVAILVAGLLFECAWYKATGSNRLGHAGTSAPEGSPASR